MTLHPRAVDPRRRTELAAVRLASKCTTRSVVLPAPVHERLERVFRIGCHGHGQRLKPEPFAEALLRVNDWDDETLNEVLDRFPWGASEFTNSLFINHAGTDGGMAGVVAGMPGLERRVTARLDSAAVAVRPLDPERAVRFTAWAASHLSAPTASRAATVAVALVEVPDNPRLQATAAASLQALISQGNIDAETLQGVFTATRRWNTEIARFRSVIAAELTGTAGLIAPALQALFDDLVDRDPHIALRAATSLQRAAAVTDAVLPMSDRLWAAVEAASPYRAQIVRALSTLAARADIPGAYAFLEAEAANADDPWSQTAALEGLRDPKARSAHTSAEHHTVDQLCQRLIEGSTESVPGGLFDHAVARLRDRILSSPDEWDLVEVLLSLLSCHDLHRIPTVIDALASIPCRDKDLEHRLTAILEATERLARAGNRFRRRGAQAALAFLLQFADPPTDESGRLLAWSQATVER